jgi:hypothetical protein
MLGALVLAASALADAANPGRDPGLDRGIRHVAAGEWNQAITVLSEVVRRLAADKTRQAEVAEACLYSGLAYVGLGQSSPARSQFSQALLRNPEIRLDPGAPKAALDLFEEVRREASGIVQGQPSRKKSKLPLVAVGVLAVGAGAAVAAGGGDSSAPPPSTEIDIPTSFTITGSTGTPQLLILTAMPPSASTINVQSAFSLLLTFVFLNQPDLPGRVQVRIEMLGALGACPTGTSEVIEIDRAAASFVATITAYSFSCPIPFHTTSMNVRLFDADANIPVSLTTYAGGYRFVP